MLLTALDWFKKMLSILFVQVLAIVEIFRISAQSCGPRELHADTLLPSNLTSPNYPSNYPPLTTCEWTITAPPGYVVELSFVTFETEGFFYSGSCSSIGDNLEISTGRYLFSRQLRGKYCSNYLPPNVYSSGTSLYLRFTSDSTVEEKGFKIKYLAVIPKPDTTICSPFNTFSQNNNIQVSGSSGYIESPLYGDKYPSSMQCTWVITVPEGKEVKLTFLEFSVGKKGYGICSASEDILEIRDGQYQESAIIGDFCFSYIPSPVTSSGRHLWIRFTSNSDNLNDEEYGKTTTGFRIRYEEISSTVARVDGTLIGFVVAVVVVFFLLIMVCVCLRKSRGPTSGTQMTQQVAQTTLTYNRQNPSAPSYPTVHYSPAPQSSYPHASSRCPPPTQGNNQQPPPGGYPTSTTGGTSYTTQPSAPIRDHSPGIFLNDPPPIYPEVVADVPPPPYPGISQNPSQVATMQNPATS